MQHDERGPRQLRIGDEPAVPPRVGFSHMRNQRQTVFSSEPVDDGVGPMDEFRAQFNRVTGESPPRQDTATDSIARLEADCAQPRSHELAESEYAGRTGAEHDDVGPIGQTPRRTCLQLLRFVESGMELAHGSRSRTHHTIVSSPPEPALPCLGPVKTASSWIHQLLTGFRNGLSRSVTLLTIRPTGVARGNRSAFRTFPSACRD